MSYLFSTPRYGGRRGIRTPNRFHPTPVFKTGAIAILPDVLKYGPPWRDLNPQTRASACSNRLSYTEENLGGGDGPPPRRIRVTGDFCHTKYGASDRNRTYNLMITNQLLYRLSYGSLLKFLIPRIEEDCKCGIQNQSRIEAFPYPPHRTFAIV